MDGCAPREELCVGPTDYPRAHPIARVVGEVPACCTRAQRRPRWRDLGADVGAPLPVNGPGPENRSAIYDEPAVTEAVTKMMVDRTDACPGQLRAPIPCGPI